MKTKSKNESLSRLFRMTKGYRGRILFLISASAAGAVLSVLFALGCKYLLDEAFTGEFRFFAVASFFLVFLLISQSVLDFVSNSVTQKVKQGILLRTRDEILLSALESDYDCISRFHTGDLSGRALSDVQIAAEGCVDLIPFFVFSVARFVVATVVLTYMAGAYALIFLLLLICFSAVAFLTKNKLKFLHKDVQESFSENRSFLQETLSCLLTVKIFSAEKRFRKEYHERQMKFLDLRFKRWFFHRSVGAAFNIVKGAVYLSALILGGLCIRYGKFSFGGFVAALQLVAQAQSPITDFPLLLSKYFTVLASVERISEIENTEREDGERLDGAALYSDLNGFIFKNVSYSYDGKNNALSDICFTAKKGLVTAIEGPSGCGKTTLLLLLSGLRRPTSGKVMLLSDGSEVEVSALHRNLFSYVSGGEGCNLFAGTIRENITFFDKSVSDEKCEEALRIACAYDFVSQLPSGTDTPLGEKGSGLSTGQKQRLAVARALLGGAPVLLLDEATSALDEKTEREILENLKSLENKTIFIVAHGKDALSVCDRVIVMREGRVEKEGSL